MAWTAPRTWVAGEIVTAALFNTHIRDNLRYLKGTDGAVTIDDDLTVNNLITSGSVDTVDVSLHASGDARTQHIGGVGDHTHTSSGAEGGQLAASAVTAGRFSLDQMPTGSDGLYLKGKGTASSPAYGALEVTGVSAIGTRSQMTISTWETLHTVLVPSTAKNIYITTALHKGGGFLSGDYRLACSYDGTELFSASFTVSATPASGQPLLIYTYTISGVGTAASAEFAYFASDQYTNAYGYAYLFYDYIS